jgi:very-short-patch-repair endonuclease
MLDSPFRGTEALAAGLLTRDQLYGPRFCRVFPDVYVVAGATWDLATRARAAFLLVRDRGGVLAGHSAALLLGADCARGEVPAEVLVPRFVRRYPGLRVRYETVTESELAVVDGCVVTTPERTAWDLARWSSLVEGVVAVDALARRGAFGPAELLARRAKQPGARGSGRLGRVVALADPRAESPMESRLRVGLVRAGLSTPEVQYEVRDEHDFVLARVDLAYPMVKLAIEYDGEVHFSRQARERDLRRDGRLAGYGWLTLRLVADDVTSSMRQTVERVRDLLALRRHGGNPPPNSS